MKLYMIKDVVVGRFDTTPRTITLFNNDAEARRALKFLGSKPNELTDKAGDIQLFCLGEFDDLTGSIIQVDEVFGQCPYLVGTLADYIGYDLDEIVGKKEEVKNES